MAKLNINPLLIIGPYDEKLSPGIDCTVEPSMTKQSFRDECDINTIMKRFERTGVLDFVNEHEARYGDATALDYQSALNVVIQAEGMFADMPAHLRKRFNNDPALFLEFIDNPENIEESVKLGLRTEAVKPLIEPETAPPAPPAS